MEQRERHFRPGERVPGTEYVVVRLEAEGGHGALYLVKHHFLEKKMQMLKTLRSFDPSADLVERLKREAQMLAAMDHPHIVSVTSGGLTDERTPRPYFVMERLKGRSLADIVPEAPMGVGVDAALKVTIEVCDALEYVHTRHGIVHRDIKPDNIFLQVTPRNGSVTKILDFGVAHMIDLETRYTKQNLFLGTPRYAAPEQILGEKPVPQTDLYAVGLVLYELLVGHGPFDDMTTFGELAKAHTQLPPPPFPTDRRFPDGLESLVLSLLGKEPSKRPKSAELLATQLRQIKRAAEQAERRPADDLSKTEATVVQNLLTARRAELTGADAPPDPASLPATARSGSGYGTTVSDPPPGSLHTGLSTAAVASIGYHPTLPTPERPEALNLREAPTRSLDVELLPARRAGSDTEHLPGPSGWLPPPETPGSESSIAGPALPAPVEPASAATDPPSPSAPRARRSAILPVAGVGGVVLVAGVTFMAMRAPHTNPVAASPLTASPTSAGSGTVAKVSAPTVATTPSTAPTPAAVSTAVANPIPSASAAAATAPSSPPSSTLPLESPAVVPKASPAPTRRHRLPSSGL